MPRLEVREVTKRFPIRRGLWRRVRGWVRAVDRVSLTLEPGATLGLVGESGCGKTTLARVILGLLPADDGLIELDGRPLAAWQARDRRALRRFLQVVFQDPLDSLEPRWTVEQIVAEPLRATQACAPREITTRVRVALEDVQLSPDLVGAYPHELSGGQRQRVGIARAIAVRPSVIVCDEPVSSLDLSIQAQVLRLLRGLQERHQPAYLFISHDLGVVHAVSQTVAVMYLGAIVERGPTAEIMAHPWHPYTEALLAAIPRPDVGDSRGGPRPEGGAVRPVQPLGGEPPPVSRIPSGCRFRTRCPLAEAVCEWEEPSLIEKSPGRFVACHLRP